jgi:hypothetical protein
MSANIDVFSTQRSSSKLNTLHKQVDELEQAVTTLTVLVKRLQSDLSEDPWKKPGHPWNQVRNPRHLPR